MKLNVRFSESRQTFITSFGKSLNISGGGYSEGYTAGYDAGYKVGYDAGETEGYNRGYEEGNSAGYKVGLADGKAEGYRTGYAEGDAAGYARGYGEGDAAGYERGYAEGYAEGYNEGKEDGITEGFEAGQKAEYDAFWDVFQNKGGTKNYYYAFAYDRFTDANYNPKYDIKCLDGTTPSRYMYYNSFEITDTKVPIYFNSGNANYAFASSNLVTIRYLYIYETTILSNTFANCPNLVNLTIDGTIGSSMQLGYSPSLSVESMKSVISHLKNYAGTSSEGANSIKFTTECWAALEADSTAPDGGTWENYVVSTLGWSV